MSASLARRQRRAHRQPDRLRGADLARVETIQRALLDDARGTPLAIVPGAVVLLSPGFAPRVADWASSLDAWIAAGVLLHDDTIARVERILATGSTPTLVAIGDWLDVIDGAVHQMQRGGEA